MRKGEKPMEEKQLAEIYFELSTLVRHATSSGIDKKLKILERSAYLLLHELSTRGPLGVKALADHFRLDISTISRQTAGLEAKGYIRRLPDPADGRSSFFEITESGMHEFERTKRIRVKRLTRFLQEWSPEECHTLHQLLVKLNHSLQDG